jgi:hypothetical protein
MTAFRESICESFEKQPVRTVAEACDRIFQWTGPRRGPSQVRKFVSRARRRLGLDEERRFQASTVLAEGLAERFIQACRAGDLRTVEGLLAEDAEVTMPLQSRMGHNEAEGGKRTSSDLTHERHDDASHFPR